MHLLITTRYNRIIRLHEIIPHAFRALGSGSIDGDESRGVKNRQFAWAWVGMSRAEPGYVYTTYRCAQSPHTYDEDHLTTNGSSSAGLSRRAKAWSIGQGLVLGIRIACEKTTDRPVCW